MIVFTDRAGVKRMDPETGAISDVLAEPKVAYHTWSADGRTLFVLMRPPERPRILAFTPPDTTPRTVA